MARGQGIELSFDDSLVDHIAKVGFIPEFGARELRRRIQVEVETKLAKEMLSGAVKEGDTVRLSYSAKEGVKIEKVAEREKAGTQAKRNH